HVLESLGIGEEAENRFTRNLLPCSSRPGVQAGCCISFSHCVVPDMVSSYCI
ncbi:Os02g0564100, partial [Oryza sativa Japonica Group]